MVSVIEWLLALPLWQPDALWWPLVAGLSYALLWVALSYAMRGVGRWQSRQTAPNLVRLSRWPGWSLIGRGLGLALGLIWVFLMLTGGVFAPDDVGVSPVAWEVALPWAAAITVGAAAWLSALWLLYGQRARPAYQRRACYSGYPFAILLDTAAQETRSAIFRAALIPWLGPYWGIWGAVVGKALVSRLDPELRACLQAPDRRPAIYLSWALDWVSAALFLFGQSVWIALAGRALCHLLVIGALTSAANLRRHHKAPDLMNDQRQDDQRSEHGGGQDTDVLQVA